MAVLDTETHAQGERGQGNAQTTHSVKRIVDIDYTSSISNYVHYINASVGWVKTFIPYDVGLHLKGPYDVQCVFHADNHEPIIKIFICTKFYYIDATVLIHWNMFKKGINSVYVFMDYNITSIHIFSSILCYITKI